MKNRIFYVAGGLVLGLAVLLAVHASSLTANAQEGDLNILAGDDQFKVVDVSFNFSDNPIPPDFFGPGSEPFDGVVEFCGREDNAPDTTIRRLSDINFPPAPSQGMVPIELVQLDLVSCQPIVVNHSDDSQELWNVQVDLPPADLLPPPGQMTIRRDHNQGGTFDSQLPVQPRFIFMRVGDGTITEPGDIKSTAEPLVFDSFFDAFIALNVPWFVCPNTESDFCIDPSLDPFTLSGENEGNWFNLLVLPPPQDDEPEDCLPAVEKIRDSADKIESSKSPKAQEIVDRLRLIAETIEVIREETGKQPPTECPDLQ